MEDGRGDFRVGVTRRVRGEGVFETEAGDRSI
jgi:hypothetical protein